MKKIIIRTPNFLGDTINTTPCLQLIKQEYPTAQIIIVCPDFIKDVFKYDKRISKCITFSQAQKNNLSTFWHLFKAIHKEKADLGILFTNTFISALIFKLAGVKYCIGYKREERGFLLDFELPLNRNKHYINRYCHLFNEYIHNKYKTLPELNLYISNKTTFHFENTQPAIGLYLGGENKSFRRYPDIHSIHLLQLLSKRNYNLVLIGDDDDNIKHQEYLDKAGINNIINLSGQTSLEDFFNTISHLDLLITIDSSAMHIAAALKTPFIVLMGLSTSPISTIVPKVDFGKILKIENNLIREEDYIQNITPEIILNTIDEVLPTKSIPLASAIQQNDLNTEKTLPA